MRSTGFAFRGAIRGTAACLLLCGLAARTPAGLVVPELDLRASARTRLLVIAPHPADEGLGTGGPMQRVLATRAPVAGVR